MPAKRVSVKGQGADLFFGGTRPPSADEQRPDKVRIEAATRPDVSVRTTEIPAAPDAAHLTAPDLPSNDPDPLHDTGTTSGSSDGGISDSEHDSYRASELASTTDDGIEAIRRVVKQTGREVSFVRLSLEEKGRLADIVYTYRRQGRKTTENELNRIAINALLDDYDAHGAQSVLARVLDALHA